MKGGKRGQLEPVTLPGVCPRSIYSLDSAISKKLHPSQPLVKQVFAPLLVPMTDQAHELPRAVQGERPRAARELQPVFCWCAIPLAVVAHVTASHEILPRRPPPP